MAIEYEEHQVVVPSLDDASWKRNPYTNLDKALANMYVTDFSQSKHDYGKVISISKIMVDHKDLDDLMTALKLNMTDYLERIFSTVTMDVTEDVVARHDGLTTIYISGQVTYLTSLIIPFNMSVTMKDSKLVKVLRTVNEK